MKDYIYPLRNVSVDAALGEERSARLYPPNVQQACFSHQHRKNKGTLLWADCRILNKHAWRQSSGNKALQKWSAHAAMCRAKYRVLSSTRTSEGPSETTPDWCCSLFNDSDQYFRDS